MKKVKENLRCVIMALIIAIPLYVMLYGAVIDNYELTVTSVMSMFIWIPLVLWIEDKIDKYFNK